jgi:LytS/YehU family sensor histidine kinase
LNGVTALVRRDPKVAEEMLANISEMLRFTLANDGRQEIPLCEELDFVDRYLELQVMRFGNRLAVERDIDPAAFDCLVPSLLVQPLVENAIRHGIEPLSGAGVIRIIVRREADRLEVEVEDNGCGLPGTQGVAGSGRGIGLRSVRERLAALYGSAQSFELSARPQGGTLAALTIPIRNVGGQAGGSHVEEVQ